MQETVNFNVCVGDGQKIQSQGMCSNLSITIGEIELTSDCYPFQLGGIDLILGVSWLEKLKKYELIGNICT